MNKENGFTFVELITAMIIFGILAATAVPNFTQWRVNYQIRAEADRVHMDLLVARMTAIKNNNNVVVTYVTGTSSYSILDDTNNNGTADTGETLVSRSLDNNVFYGFNGASITDPDGNSVSEWVRIGPSGPTDVVTFDSRGQADVAGVIFLIHSYDANVDNSRVRAISIIPATGAAELWEYNGNLNPPWE